MAEACVRTLKRDYVRVRPTPDARTDIDQPPTRLAHYGEVYPPRRWATDHPASTSSKPARSRQALNGQRHSTIRQLLRVSLPFLDGRAEAVVGNVVIDDVMALIAPPLTEHGRGCPASG